MINNSNIINSIRHKSVPVLHNPVQLSKMRIPVPFRTKTLPTDTTFEGLQFEMNSVDMRVKDLGCSEHFTTIATFGLSLLQMYTIHVVFEVHVLAKVFATVLART